ncbi:hypothetical protein GCM10009799_24360 [Nocardiopsis rhodophaea]|uniref:Uncharacterized protein n=1 Tax=Nocardiopsis rhodophaea TaxID=280238 RepID=A0ABP5EI55_9ACTN
MQWLVLRPDENDCVREKVFGGAIVEIVVPQVNRKSLWQFDIVQLADELYGQGRAVPEEFVECVVKGRRHDRKVRKRPSFRERF